MNIFNIVNYVYSFVDTWADSANFRLVNKLFARTKTPRDKFSDFDLFMKNDPIRFMMGPTKIRSYKTIYGGRFSMMIYRFGFVPDCIYDIYELDYDDWKNLEKFTYNKFFVVKNVINYVISECSLDSLCIRECPRITNIIFKYLKPAWMQIIMQDEKFADVFSEDIFEFIKVNKIYVLPRYALRIPEFLEYLCPISNSDAIRDGIVTAIRRDNVEAYNILKQYSNEEINKGVIRKYLKISYIEFFGSFFLTEELIIKKFPKLDEYEKFGAIEILIKTDRKNYAQLMSQLMHETEDI